MAPQGSTTHLLAIALVFSLVVLFLRPRQAYYHITSDPYKPKLEFEKPQHATTAPTVPCTGAKNIVPAIAQVDGLFSKSSLRPYQRQTRAEY